MKKILPLAILLITVISCDFLKKDTKTNEPSEETTTKSEELKNEPVIKKEVVFAVIKDSAELDSIKQSINTTDVNWKKWGIDEDDLKIGVIEITESKQDEIINTLKTNRFFETIESEKNISLDALIKREKAPFITLKQTPCVGDCPVFNVSISKKGKLTFQGKQYVLKTGTTELQLTDKQFNKLKELLNKQAFSSFKSKYDNPKISDLSSTFINYNGKQVEIRLWKNIPDALINIYAFFEDILITKKLLNE